MNIYKQSYFIFIIGGIGYPILEILWRGYTHPSMAVVGGLCLVAIFFVNTVFYIQPKAIRAALCAVGITVIELFSGVFINIYLGLNVWDYSILPLNFMGQICLPYTFLWYGLSYAIIYAGEKLRVFSLI